MADETAAGGRPDVDGLIGVPQRLQNWTPVAFCAPQLLQKKGAFMTRHYKDGPADCQSPLCVSGKDKVRSARPHYVAQRQLQPAELGMVVHAERVGNIEAVAGQQLQPVAGFLESPSHRFECNVVAPTGRG
jgi:hypothetical protein